MLEGAGNWQAFDIAITHVKPLLLQPKVEGGNVLAKLAAGVGAVAGLESAESSGGFRSLFKDVFKKRTIEEMEAQFAVGIPETTPALSQIDARLASTWVFFRLIVFSVLATLGFYWGANRFNNDILQLGWMLVGAFGIPFAVLVFFMETNILKNVSFYRVLKLFMLGGLVSLIFTMLLNEATGLGGISPVFAGPIEESAKILAVVLFTYKWKQKNWTLNGMLFGAAVGAGFGAFETMGYIVARSGGNFEGVMIMRAFFAPFMHVLWTASAGAALWRSKGEQSFSFGMLWEWRFLRVLLVVAGIHATWNSPLRVPFVGEPWDNILKCVALGIIGWLLILLLIQDGLAQIRKAQANSKS